MRFNKLKINNTAVLVIDIQRDFFTKKDPEDFLEDLDDMNAILKPLKTFITKCRKMGLQIIFTKYIEEKNNIPENILEKHLNGYCLKNNGGDELFEVESLPEDLIIEKRTWDAFTNPELTHFLKKQSIKNLIVCGVTTEMCVFSTISSAFAKGCTVFVPMELVATQKSKKHVHETILKLIQSYYGFVNRSEEIINILKRNQITSK